MSKTRQDISHREKPAYVVLARKYRPGSFDELIGQDAMVQTLANAFRLGRIAQGFMLTGVRGVGKTTTARILARALNYEAKGDGEDHGPTIDMPEAGVHCQAIMESRHVDVLEMDAASHTGVDDIREIIESTRYKPISARYKVFIIDEVHMLSKSAFNALLKTLEEPPEHVKFIFATTEVQKVPVTVLSRCQRFDLKRIEMDELIRHFSRIAKEEGVRIDDDALALIARAAEGSVRDGLSILDQAMAHAREGVSGVDIRAMLGLADRMRIFDVLESLLKGDAGAALKQCEQLYVDGADPRHILVDLAETVHILTRCKVVADMAGGALGEAERQRAGEMAGRLSIPVLSRCWQMLVKGIDECAAAPDQMAAVEMIVIRIAYAADLPTPRELARAIGGSGDREFERASRSSSPPLQEESPGSGDKSASGPALVRGANEANEVDMAGNANGPVATAAMQKPAEVFCDDGTDPISGFEEMAELVGKNGGLVLKLAFEEYVRPLSFEQGAIEIALADGAPAGLANDIKRVLNGATGANWIVAVSERPGGETLREKKQREHDAELDKVRQHPLVRKALEHFPDARITDIRPLAKGGGRSTDTKENK